MKRNKLIFIILMMVNFPLEIKSSETDFVINGKSIKELMFGNAEEAGSPPMNVLSLTLDSGSDEHDVASITMDHSSITVKWRKTPLNYNEIGSRKKESTASTVLRTEPDFLVDKLFARDDLWGCCDQNMTLRINKARFENSSICFKDNFAISPVDNYPSIIKSLSFTKRPGITYPMIRGLLNFSSPDSVLKPIDQDLGFYIMGCNVTFLLDVTNFKNLTLYPESN